MAFPYASILLYVSIFPRVLYHSLSFLPTPSPVPSVKIFSCLGELYFLACLVYARSIVSRWKYPFRLSKKLYLHRLIVSTTLSFQQQVQLKPYHVNVTSDLQMQ